MLVGTGSGGGGGPEPESPPQPTATMRAGTSLLGEMANRKSVGITLGLKQVGGDDERLTPKFTLAPELSLSLT